MADKWAIADQIETQVGDQIAKLTSCTAGLLLYLVQRQFFLQTVARIQLRLVGHRDLLYCTSGRGINTLRPRFLRNIMVQILDQLGRTQIRAQLESSNDQPE